MTIWNSDDEDGNPFPMDDDYQDPKLEEGVPFVECSEKCNREKRKHKSKQKPKEYEKIPIRIIGKCDIHIQADAGSGLSCGGFWGKGLGTNVESGIESAISGVEHNARVHLRLVREKRNKPNGNEALAEKIINYKGDISDLFKLVYFKYNRDVVEKQLGKYKNLERIIKKD